MTLNTLAKIYKCEIDIHKSQNNSNSCKNKYVNSTCISYLSGPSNKERIWCHNKHRLQSFSPTPARCHQLYQGMYELQHDKTNKVTVRPAKTQISLGIRPVWSKSSLCAEWVAKDPRFLHAYSEDSDQSGRMPRLIWVFAGRILILLVLSCHSSYASIFLCTVNMLKIWTLEKLL